LPPGVTPIELIYIYIYIYIYIRGGMFHSLLRCTVLHSQVCLFAQTQPLRT
jgi:hypothetical protein